MVRAASPVVRQRWQQLVDGFDAGLETVAEFCERNQVSTTSFYKWKRRLADEGGARGEALADGSAFLPVHLDDLGRGGPAVTVRHGEICIDVPVEQKRLLFELIDHLQLKIPLPMKAYL